MTVLSPALLFVPENEMPVLFLAAGDATDATALQFLALDRWVSTAAAVSEGT